MVLPKNDKAFETQYNKPTPGLEVAEVVCKYLFLNSEWHETNQYCKTMMQLGSVPRSDNEIIIKFCLQLLIRAILVWIL